MWYLIPYIVEYPRKCSHRWSCDFSHTNMVLWTNAYTSMCRVLSGLVRSSSSKISHHMWNLTVFSRYTPYPFRNSVTEDRQLGCSLSLFFTCLFLILSICFILPFYFKHTPCLLAPSMKHSVSFCRITLMLPTLFFSSIWRFFQHSW